MNSLELSKAITEVLSAKLAEDIVIMDLRDVSSVTDFMIIATGKADTHVKAITNGLVEDMKKNYKERPLFIEGQTLGSWVCVDYGDVIVHIMRQQERETYDLTAIWGENRVI